MKHSESKKARLFTRILPELAAAAPYFSVEHVEARVKALGIDFQDALLREYMSDAMAKGIVHDAGRGWYSRIAAPFVLDTKPLKGIISRIEKAFPLLEFSCWSTEQINPYMHHLLGQFATVAYADKDLLPALYEELQGWKGYRVHLDPSSADAKKFRVDDKTIVIRSQSSEPPPTAEPHVCSVEQLLVDLALEVEELSLMSRGEYQEMAWRMATSGRISIPTLVRYARRNHRKLDDIFGSNLPTNGTNS